MATAFSIGVAACGGGEAATPTTAAPAPASADGGSSSADNLFPNVEVTNISDGSALNLQEELQGGDLPVLLWFFAPH